MDPLVPKKYRKGPERIIQDKIMAMLLVKGWYVMETHGNMYQSGFPDLFATHTKYGIRWIEVKLPAMKGSKFTPAQIECFPKLCANGAGVWILTGDSETEYKNCLPDLIGGSTWTLLSETYWSVC